MWWDPAHVKWHTNAPSASEKQRLYRLNQKKKEWYVHTVKKKLKWYVYFLEKKTQYITMACTYMPEQDNNWTSDRMYTAKREGDGCTALGTQTALNVKVWKNQSCTTSTERDGA
jgi:hypothetical protein